LKGYVVKNDRNTITLDNFQILSPYRAGYAGTMGINDYIRREYRKPGKNEWVQGSTFIHSDKIIRTTNWYDRDRYSPEKKFLKLSNGSIGIVCVKNNSVEYYTVSAIS
jgi:ATP-dependent exoDNAse (exonuclease V) alpha subunit